MKRLLIYTLTIFIVSCSAQQDGVDANSETISETPPKEEMPKAESESAEPEYEETFIPMVLPHFVTTNSCLPEPSKRFLGWIESDSLYYINEYYPDYIYLYLVTHLDSLGPKQITYEGDSLYGPRISTQNFSNGLEYVYTYFPEKGSSGEITTQCTDRKEFYQSFSKIIYSPENEWNSDSTTYEPEGAGCYYDIKQNTDGYFYAYWSCGC